ncbi:hypothetical protein [Shewanella aestuarii]|uniref:Uncharacterized protein n=1 Tax=Shewanella aestuarii TaxID=1028752 RepID=A0A6G9QLY6_9GAMM|nr:hypothetical protein [Shewanella aestuarii]QIR15492.1 hypothetical protein HBH39_14135 [Shewanella aestuarii]
MNRKVVWSINLIVLTLLLVSITVSYHHLYPTKDLMLSCSSELFDRTNTNGSEQRHYLLVDVVAKNQQAQINYRYFNLDGSSAGSILMHGKLIDVDQHNNRYHFSVTTKQETEHNIQGEQPQHMQYLSYISSLNIDSQKMHNLSIEPLELDTDRDYAIVLFQPSNTVCGCRIVN